MSEPIGIIPKIADVVHYVRPMGGHRAAIITGLDNYGLEEPFISHPEVSLCVLNPDGMVFLVTVPYNEDTNTPHTWHYPERD